VPSRPRIGSPFGKTGAWVVIATRKETADVWVGLREPVEPHRYRDLGWNRALDALELGAWERVLGLPHSARRSSGWTRLPSRGPVRALLLVLEGEGEGELDGLSARPGDAFVLPASAERFDVAGDIRVFRCLAPEPYAPKSD
jgi:hypothetical protein